MNDAALVGLALADPQQGVAAIYDRYGTSLYNYCYSILRSQADAGDALQESFVAVMGKLAQLRDPSKLRPWLYAIARNQCYKRHRQRDRERPEDPFETHEQGTGMTASPAEPSPGTELVAMVWEATAGLSEVDRSVLELNIRHELDGEELAQSLGVPGPKCSVMLHRAKDRLKTAVGALIVARVGTEACSDLAGIVRGSEFSPLVRKRVSRHITACAVCEDTERRHRPEAYLAAVPLLPIPARVHKGVLDLIGDGTGLGGAGEGAGSGQPDHLDGHDFRDSHGVDPVAAASTVRMQLDSAVEAADTDGVRWNDDGFPYQDGVNDPIGSNAGRRGAIAMAAVACVVALIAMLAVLNPFDNETTLIAGPATAPEPTALTGPQFEPTATPLPPITEPNSPASPPPPQAPSPTPTAPRPTSAPVVPPAAALPTAVPPTATATAQPTVTPTVPTPTVTTPAATPTSPPAPTATTPPVATPPGGPVAPTSGPVFADLGAPTVTSFTVSCGDPFVLTVVVGDNLDPNPTADLEATWEDESDPALPLTLLSGSTYRVNVPRSELVGEHIAFFVRGTLTDNSANTRSVDLTDDCTIIG